MTTGEIVSTNAKACGPAANAAGFVWETSMSILLHAGLARAREQGKTLGRPRLGGNAEKAIRKALRKGDTGMRKIAIKFEVATGTVQRIKAELVA